MMSLMYRYWGENLHWLTLDIDTPHHATLFATTMADNPAAKIAEIFRHTIFEVDIFGFEPASVTIEKAAAKKEKKKDAVAAAVEAPTEAAAAAIHKGAEYEPLRPGESLWDEGMSRRRLHNIVGGWV
jgi:hypothetical protein